MGTGSILLRELGSHMPHGSAKKKGFFLNSGENTEKLSSQIFSNIITLFMHTKYGANNTDAKHLHLLSHWLLKVSMCEAEFNL